MSRHAHDVQAVPRRRCALQAPAHHHRAERAVQPLVDLRAQLQDGSRFTKDLELLAGRIAPARALVEHGRRLFDRASIVTQVGPEPPTTDAARPLAHHARLARRSSAGRERLGSRHDGLDHFSRADPVHFSRALRPHIGFLFIGPRLRSPIPPHGRSPFRSCGLLRRDGRLSAGLSPARSRPCWAHTTKARPIVRRALIVVNSSISTDARCDVDCDQVRREPHRGHRLVALARGAARVRDGRDVWHPFPCMNVPSRARGRFGRNLPLVGWRHAFACRFAARLLRVRSDLRFRLTMLLLPEMCSLDLCLCLWRRAARGRLTALGEMISGHPTIDRQPQIAVVARDLCRRARLDVVPTTATFACGRAARTCPARRRRTASRAASRGRGSEGMRACRLRRWRPPRGA
jgi:hypothetical protein